MSEKLVLTGNGEFYTAIRVDKANGEIVCHIPMILDPDDKQERYVRLVERYNEHDGLVADNEYRIGTIKVCNRGIIDDLTTQRDDLLAALQKIHKLNVNNGTCASIKSCEKCHHQKTCADWITLQAITEAK